MRVFLSILIALMFSLKATAARPSSSRPQILKYSQIMKLSKTKRIRYLRQLAKLLVLMEKQQAKYEVASTEFEDLKEQVAMLIRLSNLMPEAAAAGTEYRSIGKWGPKSVADLNKTVPVWNPKIGPSGKFECLPADKVRFLVELGSCVIKTEGSIEYHHRMFDIPCPEGSHELFLRRWVQNHKYCISNASWNQLSPEVQSNLTADRLFKVREFKGLGEVETRTYMTTGKKLAPSPLALALAASSPASAKAAEEGKKALKAEAAAKLAEASVTPVTPAAATETLGEKTSPLPSEGSNETPAEVTAEAAPGDAAAGETAAGDTAAGDTPSDVSGETPGDATNVQPASVAGTCAPPEPEQCSKLSASEEKEMIAKFKKSQASGECIRGGFFGKYEGNKYRRGRCLKSKASYASRLQARACPKNTEICNPVLFCYGFDAKDANDPAKSIFRPGPTCAHVSQTFTADCESNFRKFIDGQPRTVGGQEGVVLRACDPATDVKNIPFYDEYNQLIEETKKSYDRLCGAVSEFKAKFCTECNVIRAHLAQANCEATGTSAPLPSPADGKTEPSSPLPEPSTPATTEGGASSTQ